MQILNWHGPTSAEKVRFNDLLGITTYGSHVPIIENFEKETISVVFNENGCVLDPPRPVFS